MMNGAKIQFFVHEKLPHVFPIYDFPVVKSLQEAWKEIRLFVQDIINNDKIVTKAERVHWDGSRVEIAEDEYITMSRDEVFHKVRDLTFNQLLQQMRQSLDVLTNDCAEYVRLHPKCRYIQ
jgi:hypothetical protein